MNTPFGRSVCFSFPLFLAFASALCAQQSIAGGAPVPPQLAAARTIFLSNGGGSNYFNQFTGGPDRAYNTLYADLRQLGRYELSASPSQADLILEVRSVAPAVDNSNVVVYNPQLIVTFIDPQTKAVLWTAGANVQANGTQKRRDGKFDESVAVLVDKVEQATGQPLTTEQLKAVRDNAGPGTTSKVLRAIL
jgi:hypothetical protein